MSIEIAEKLDEARALLERRGAWTQDWYAKNAAGFSALPHSPDAVCWCALGALRRAYGGDKTQNEIDHGDAAKLLSCCR